MVADKGYHSDATLAALEEVGVRSYLSEPDRGRRRWRDKSLPAKLAKLPERTCAANRLPRAVTGLQQSAP